jgi:hypothetical protein
MAYQTNQGERPMKYGPETPTVEAFIRHLKGVTKEQRAAVDAALDAAGAPMDAALNAVLAAMDAAADAAAMWYAASDVVRYAIYEILGATLIRERGQSFYFLPLFGFADPEAVMTADQTN